MGAFVSPVADVSFPCLCSGSSSSGAGRISQQHSSDFTPANGSSGVPFICLFVYLSVNMASCLASVPVREQHFSSFYSVISIEVLRRARPDLNTVASIVPVVNDSAPPFWFFSVFQFLWSQEVASPNGCDFWVTAHGVRGHIWVEEAIN